MAVAYPHRANIYKRASAEATELDDAGAPILPDASTLDPDYANLPCRFFEEGMRYGFVHFPKTDQGKLAIFDRLQVAGAFWRVMRVIECNEARTGALHHLEVEIETGL